ncbi:MAG: hypothetical protein WDN72_05870 [Alphaproteobacteria bacterium]
MPADDTPIVPGRYGEQTLADFDARQRAEDEAAAAAAAAPPAAPHGINWQKTLMRAALVAVGIVAAAYILPLAWPWVPVGLSYVPYVGATLGSAAASLGYGVAGVWGTAMAVPAAIGHTLFGIGAAGHAATVCVGAGTAATGVCAYPVVSHQMNAAHAGANAGTVVTAKSSVLMSDPSAHQATHGLSDASVDSNDRPSWATRIGARMAAHNTLNGGGSYSDAILAAQMAANPARARNASFTQQLESERAALNRALADPQR